MNMVGFVGAILLQAASPLSDESGGMAAVQVAMDAWKICAAKQVRHYATTTREPAQTVVDAAIGSCSDEFVSVRNTLFEIKLTVKQTEELLDNLVATYRPKLVAGVLNLRQPAN